MEQEMKTKSKISGYVIRSAAYAVFLSVAFIAASWAFQSPNKWYKSAVATVGYGSMRKLLLALNNTLKPSASFA